MIFDNGHRSRSSSLTGGETSAVVENLMARENSVDSDGELSESAGSAHFMRLKSKP